MRLVQIADFNILSTAIEEGLRLQDCEISTYPVEADSLFFIEDLKPNLVLTQANFLEKIEHFELNKAKYPYIASIPWVVVAFEKDFMEQAARFQDSGLKIFHLPLPIAPLKLKNQIESFL